MMKYLAAAFALAIAAPAAAQTAAPQDHSRHQQHGPGHAQHGQGHGQHGQGHGQQGQGQQGHGQHGQRQGDHCPCCQPAANGQRPACCERMHGAQGAQSRQGPAPQGAQQSHDNH